MIVKRCAWATSPILIRYHDEKWGVPTHDETELFKMLILEGMQAGTVLEIVLKKKKPIKRPLMTLIIIRSHLMMIRKERVTLSL